MQITADLEQCNSNKIIKFKLIRITQFIDLIHL